MQMNQLSYGVPLHLNDEILYDEDLLLAKGRVSTRIVISVTRFGDLLDFGQLFKFFGNN